MAAAAGVRPVLLPLLEELAAAAAAAAFACKACKAAACAAILFAACDFDLSSLLLLPAPAAAARLACRLALAKRALKSMAPGPSAFLAEPAPPDCPRPMFARLGKFNIGFMPKMLAKEDIDAAAALAAELEAAVVVDVFDVDVLLPLLEAEPEFLELEAAAAASRIIFIEGKILELNMDGLSAKLANCELEN